MVTNKLTFAVFALVVLFPIYFDHIFLYTVTESGWTFDFYSYLHFSILSKFNLLFFSILFFFFFKFEDDKLVREDDEPFNDPDEDEEIKTSIYAWWHAEMPEKIKEGFLNQEEG